MSDRKVTQEEIEKYTGQINHGGSYDGQGDQSHLGGCAKLGDAGTYYPVMWQELTTRLNVKSVIDVGCGVGWSTKWFKDNGCTVRGIEGLQEAIDASPVKQQLRKHDYADGPYTPPKGARKYYDLCWSCEFVEHVEEKFADNFIETFKCAKYIAMTHAVPGQGGFHHVNEQPSPYWVHKMRQHGLVLDWNVTNALRGFAELDRDAWGAMEWDARVTHPEPNAEIPEVAPWYADFHFVKRGLFFVNINQ